MEQIDILFGIVFVVWIIGVVVKRKNRSPEDFDEYGFVSTGEIEQINCSSCGKPYDMDCQKCPNCGAKETQAYDVKFCRNCKNTYEPRFKICPYCMTEGWIEKEEEGETEV